MADNSISGKRITIRQLAEAAELLRYLTQRDDVLTVEYRRKDGGVGRLSKIRFGLAASGRRTKRVIDCLDDNVERCYDKNYDFEVLARLINGKQMP